ncbi:MAG: cell division protein ZapA [Magnetospirillum sp.]|nr:MAG: cell division protein ZapA [Magnetospirillum sp.]
MAFVNVTINGRVYDIACDDSQVSRVQDLGREVDARAQHLLSTVGNVSDSRLLVMVGLLLADELTEAREQLSKLGQEVAAAAEGDIRLAGAIESLAQRIEGIATRLERA